MNQLKFKGDEYVFAVVTCGGNPAGTLPQLAKMLQTRGIELKAGFAVVQPDNYIPWHGAIPEEKQARLFALKDTRLPDIIGVIRNKKTEPLEQNSAIVNFALGLVYKKQYKVESRL